MKAQILKAADLVENGWTRHTMARDIDGYPCSVGSYKATCFCLSGALAKATDDGLSGDLSAIYNHVRNYLRQNFNKTSIVNFNDNDIRSGKEAAEFLRKVANEL